MDVDRYTLNGNYQQVMLAARELNQARLPADAQTWINQHFKFTHGFGLVMSPVNRFDAEGLPVFYIQDIPPTSSVGLTLDRPQIYFGEETRNYVVVRGGTTLVGVVSISDVIGIARRVTFANVQGERVFPVHRILADVPCHEPTGTRDQQHHDGDQPPRKRLEGCIGRLYTGLPILCTVNPGIAHEELQTPAPLSRVRRVVVVGGGPAGMEAARVAAERGHDVTLFERTGHAADIRFHIGAHRRGKFSVYDHIGDREPAARL